MKTGIGTAPDMSIAVRTALEEDAVAACEVLRRSIRELGVTDHGHDEEVLSVWLANKTPGNVRVWTASPSRFSVVAVDGSTVRGFGMMQRDGEIQLCYLVPEAQHTGAPESSCCAHSRNKPLGGGYQAYS